MHPDGDPRAAADAAAARAACVPLLLIIGPPGVGKSSAARQVSRLLEDDRVGFAYVDRDDFGVDGLLDDDPLADLQRILLARVAEGAERLVVAWRIDSDAELIRFRASLPWAAVTVCGLRAGIQELLDRIARGQESFQRLHLQSMAVEMAPRLEGLASGGILLATDDAPPQVVAMDALRQWDVGVARAVASSPGSAGDGDGDGAGAAPRSPTPAAR
jgi:energy-coupling factor transporter ATP-binding protein EcfA2